MRNALLGFIMLTALDGSAIWVESSAVTIIRNDHTGCAAKATAISVSGKGLCVKETSDQIREKIKQAGE